MASRIDYRRLDMLRDRVEEQPCGRINWTFIVFWLSYLGALALGAWLLF